MKYAIIGIMALLCHDTFSQKYDINWVFGDSAGFKFQDGEISYFESNLVSYEPIACISDSLGNLLFYTNGNKVWDKNNDIMPLGNNLLISGAPLSSTTQGTVIIPDPADINKFYIINIDGLNIRYSRVNLLLNDGNGAVSDPNSNLFTLPTPTQKMTAVKHGNGRDWWLILQTTVNITSDINITKFWEFIITPDGITFNDSVLGIEYNDNFLLNEIGQMKFSKSGNLIGCTNGHVINIYDFDRCSGTINHFKIIDSIISGSTNYVYGLEFSQSEELVYVTTGGLYNNKCFLYQLNLNSEIDEIKHKLYSTSISDSTFYILAQLQIAPDNKIYLAMPSNENYYENTIDNNYLSVINSPNEIGLDCNFDTLTIFTNFKRVTFGLPNMPNYNLGVLPKSACDTLSTSITEIKTNTDFQLFPNPVSSAFYIKSKNASANTYSLSITDVMHTEVMVVHNYISGNAVRVDDLPQGIYIVTLKDDEQVVFLEKMLIMK